ncbi:ATP-binding protein [Gilvimarinus sp. SDUM040013]|uniref:histidine kinase n=1 Tax=Gilvimarinus gilvus TaxID=3058038 RepID=A0ABU4S273_9GAMM|nr:ATP-binding protein [Gilvimarinus sp. SDUM040013]MDO3384424.1 ATP-binding protein [Gilvimarinus sp. SDUM040013]MDX6851029.1 ATP-binding protein [Gilvimarinus sp. SDUM040013]
MRKVDFFRNIGKAFDHKGIGRRLLLYIILFSSLVTLLATAVQLYTDYQRDIGQIKGRLNDIQSSHLSAISASLWNLDVDQLYIQIEGVRHLPDVDAVAVYEVSNNVINPLVVESGDFRDANAIVREYSIVNPDSSTGQVIGVLKVQASLREVYARLRDKAVVILLSQGIKTFLVSLFILFMFYRLVTVHLQAIAEHLGRYKIVEPAPRLALKREETSHKDELDQVVEAFNHLTDNLVNAYDSLQSINIALANDVAARKHAEAEVTRLNRELEARVTRRTAELEAANRELGSFCFSVSHDLRAPLRRIEGLKKVLEERLGSELSARSKHFLDRIADESHSMSEMIDSFLQLSKATQSEMQVANINVSTIVEKILNEMKAQEPERTVTLKIQADVYAEVDQRIITMLFSNLLSNAWKYTSKREHAEIEFGAYTEDSGQHIYFVKDNGSGFDMKYANRLFSPFTRLHHQDEFEGVGIGLATVQRIVARHGGHVWAEASPDDGAAFFFTLWEQHSHKMSQSISGLPKVNEPVDS